MMQEKLRDKVGRLKGKDLANNTDDQSKIIKLLNAILIKQGGTAKLKGEVYNPSTGRLVRTEVERKVFTTPVAKHCADDLHDAILNFQRVNRSTLGTVDGNTSPTGPTLKLLNALADPSLSDPKPPTPFKRDPQSGPLWTVEVKDLIMGTISTTASVIFHDRLADLSMGKPRGTYFYKFSGKGLNFLGAANPEPFTGTFNMPCRMDDPFGGPGNLESLAWSLASGIRIKVTSHGPTGGTTDVSAMLTRGLTIDFPMAGLSLGTFSLQRYVPSLA